MVRPHDGGWGGEEWMPRERAGLKVLSGSGVPTHQGWGVTASHQGLFFLPQALWVCTDYFNPVLPQDYSVWGRRIMSRPVLGKSRELIQVNSHDWN